MKIENSEINEHLQKIIDHTDVKYGQVIIKVDVADGKYKRAEITIVNRLIPPKEKKEKED